LGYGSILYTIPFYSSDPADKATSTHPKATVL
jgi:hypothetical protein